MNLTTAENIAALYEELIKNIDISKIAAPDVDFIKGAKFNMSKIYLEDGQITIDWAYYTGCGSYDRITTTHKLEEFFN
jgi:hypothetical protein